jgi:glycosyltransferase involved in cell wall biosynthesis
VTSYARETKPKVSLVVSDLSKSGAGRWGGAVRTFLLGQALQQLNYQVEIVGFVFGDDAAVVTESDLPISVIPGHELPGFLRSANQLLQKISGDIIYAVKPKPTSFGLSLLKKIQTHRPLIVDIDDWEMSWFGGDRWQYHPTPKQFARDVLKPGGALRNPDHPLYVKWMEDLISHADAVTVHTQFLKQRFGGIYVPNGKDVELFDPARHNPEQSRERYGLGGYRILMFPGAPRPYKGLEDVLVALDQLNQPDLRLVIVGGSPYDDYDEQLIQQWGRWIIKLPKVAHTLMPEVVAAAHIIVVPQRDTPAAQAQFPLKLTDGMAMAKPVLATRVGDIPEILSDTGYLADPGSPEQLAQQIQWIFDHPDEANQRGRDARVRCVDRYSLAAMSLALAKVMADLPGVKSI